jgi:hypothetical protein
VKLSAGTIRWPFIANEIGHARRCRDGRADQTQFKQFLDRGDYREGSHYDESRPSFK